MDSKNWCEKVSNLYRFFFWYNFIGTVFVLYYFGIILYDDRIKLKYANWKIKWSLQFFFSIFFLNYLKYIIISYICYISWRIIDFIFDGITCILILIILHILIHTNKGIVYIWVFTYLKCTFVRWSFSKLKYCNPY